MIEIHRTKPSGAQSLDAIAAFVARFVAYPLAHAHTAHVLWIAHTHCMEAWESTPRLAALSPEPASGKTRLLEVTELLVPNPVEAVNVTPAYLFRKVSAPEGLPTILFDEIDTVFGPKAKDNEEIRGLLNAGHRRGAVAGRCVIKGKTIETEEIPAYCAVAMAGLGGLPDTILTRAIIVKMKRRAPTERIDAYRRRVHAPQGHALRDQLAVWAESEMVALRDSYPQMPVGIDDRDADIWEPLLAIADAAGGDWPQRARVAAVALVADSKQGTPSLGIRLLADIRTVFGEGAEVLPTSDIISGLVVMEDAPWGDLRGRPLDPRGLSRRLSEYQVSPVNVRANGEVRKGYRREAFVDAWERYLPNPLSASQRESATSATSATETVLCWRCRAAHDDDGEDLCRSCRAAAS